VLPIALTTSPLLAFPTSRFVYARGEGAESCPSEATARHAVESRLGYDPFSLVADKIIVAEIVRDHEQLRGRVELVDERGMIQGAREFRTPPAQCDDLVATMALAISIAVDPTSDRVAPPSPGNPASASRSSSNRVGSQGAASDSATAPQAAAEPEPEPEPEPNEPRPSSNPSSENRREATAEALPSESNLDADEGPTRSARSGEDAVAKARAGLAILSSFGTAPDLAIGMAASFGIRWANFSVNIEGRSDWPASSPVSTGGAARASLIAGSVVPCFHRGVWFVCGLGVVGSVHGSSQDLIVKILEGNALYLGAGARAGVEVPLVGPFFFRPQLDALANFNPVELQVDNARVWKAPPFSVLIGAGVFASFP
jgi:hypothetical protein